MFLNPPIRLQYDARMRQRVFNLLRFEIALIESGLRTRGKLAEKLGCSFSYVASIALGQVPGPRSRERIAKALRISPDRLWPEIECEALERLASAG